MTGRSTISAEDFRARAHDLSSRALAEGLPNVRATYEAAAARWNSMAEREEQLGRDYAEQRARRCAELAARLGPAASSFPKPSGTGDVVHDESPGSLTLAVVSASLGRLLLLDGDLNIVAMSASFSQTFDLDPRRVIGQVCFALGAGEWNDPQLRQLLAAAAKGGASPEAIEFDLRRRGRNTLRLSAKAERLVYPDPDLVRLVLSVADVTEARAEESLREEIRKSDALLVREVRHRVANSLQMVASVLLLNARATPVEDVRRHLEAAHSRVMAIGALERQVSEVSGAQVDLQSYLGHLCENMVASVIADPNKVSLIAFVDPVVVSASSAASLGMIVTELVLNALKYAFPRDRPGRVTVAFDSTGADWVLTVSDNGVGMASGAGTRGYGTEIVNALARHLGAVVEVADAAPGTATSIRRSQAMAAGR